MKLILGLIAAAGAFATVAAAQDPSGGVRKIAPERFQPTYMGNYGTRPATAAAIAPTKEHPLGNCDPASRDWSLCLRATADLSDVELTQAESRLATSVEDRTDLNLLLKRSFAKALSEADAKWRSLREQECGELALLEAAAGTSLYEARLVCQIRHNSERIEQIAAHYGLDPAKADGATQGQ